MPIDVRQLECFIAVAEELHVGRAAARLRMTQPPLTRRIARLEREVGAELFARIPTGVELTGAGEVLLEQAYRIVQLTGHAIERARLADTGHTGSLVVGYFGSVIFGVLPGILREFRDQHPDVDLILERARKNVQADAIRDGRMHVGFARRHRIEHGLAVREIPGEPLYVAIPAGHPLAGTDEVAVSALGGEPMALFPAERPSFADEVTQLFARSGTPLSVAREAEDVVTALAYVAAARLCAVVPGSATNLALPGVEFVPLAGGRCEPLSCLYRPGEVPAPLGALLHHLETTG